MTNYMTLHNKGQNLEFLKLGIKLKHCCQSKTAHSLHLLAQSENRNTRKRYEICLNLT